MRIRALSAAFVATVLASSFAAVQSRALPVHYRIGDKVADFYLAADRGAKTRLSSFRGKTVVLVFYASWCEPCNEEAPRIEKEIWRAYRMRGVQVLGLAISEHVKDPKTKLRAFRRRHHLTYPLLSDETAAIMKRWDSRAFRRSSSSTGTASTPPIPPMSRRP